MPERSTMDVPGRSPYVRCVPVGGELLLRRLLIAALAATALATAPAAVAAPAKDAPVAHIACMKAEIGGANKCIARGQFCARAYQSDYKRYGFSCSKRDKNGRYHLT